MKPVPEPLVRPTSPKGRTEPMETVTWAEADQASTTPLPETPDVWDAIEKVLPPAPATAPGLQLWSDLGVANEAAYVERIRARLRSAALRGDRADLELAVREAADYDGISWQESIARLIFDMLASTESTLTLEQIAESGGRDWMLTIACEVAQLVHPTSADEPSTTVN